MLTLVRDLAPRIGIFNLPDVWAEEAGMLLSVLSDFYGVEISGADMIPHPDELELRRVIQRAAPMLKAVADELRERLEYDYCGLIVEQFGLDRFDLDTRRRLLYCFTLALGLPTPADQIEKRVAWDVAARELPAGQVSTISENAYEAELHTDTQYFQHPEKYLLLYTVRPAACGGGVSLLLDGFQVKARLAQTAAGQEALRFLAKRKLPFRIPTSYTTTGKQDTVEATFAPIFADGPFIRYGKDTLQAGLAAFPAYDTPEVRRALAVLQTVLQDPRQMVAVPLLSDSVLLLNNHVGLHGRTTFRDRKRHLIRIRINPAPPVSRATNPAAREQRDLELA